MVSGEYEYAIGLQKTLPLRTTGAHHEHTTNRTMTALHLQKAPATATRYDMTQPWVKAA